MHILGRGVVMTVVSGYSFSARLELAIAFKNRLVPAAMCATKNKLRGAGQIGATLPETHTQLADRQLQRIKTTTTTKTNLTPTTSKNCARLFP